MEIEMEMEVWCGAWCVVEQSPATRLFLYIDF